MKRHRRQLIFGMLVLLAASVSALWAHVVFHRKLPDYSFLSGWVLLAAMFVLTIYNVRKKLPFLPLGTSESWLQVHIYLGFFTVLLFLIHLDFRLPHGWFEVVLAWLFALVSGSGVFGLFLSRFLPRRLAIRGGEVLYEKIPMALQALRSEAEELALGIGAKSPVIADFYRRRLAGFFAGPRNFWRHLVESRRPLHALLSEATDLRRTSSETERATLERIETLVLQKDGLDYHRSLQLALKLWLFVHIPLTYGLLIFTAAHVIFAFGFSGGAR
jgi:hypothetical protein